jgi:hypothetical protein
LISRKEKALASRRVRTQPQTVMSSEGAWLESAARTGVCMKVFLAGFLAVTSRLAALFKLFNYAPPDDQLTGPGPKVTPQVSKLARQ